MPELANPMDALLTLQPAIDSGGVELQPCTLHRDLWVLVDFPNGEVRTTYVVLENDTVQCIVQFVRADPIDGIPCLSLGYATIQAARNRGLTSATVLKAIEELQSGLKGVGIRQFYIEAIVSTANVPSQKIAARALAPESKAGTDHFSGEPILQFVKLFTS
jgi:hypothetical protein